MHRTIAVGARKTREGSLIVELGKFKFGREPRIGRSDEAFLFERSQGDVLFWGVGEVAPGAANFRCR